MAYGAWDEPGDRILRLRETLQMEIRVLVPADAAAYWEIRLEGLRDEPQAFGMSAAEFQETTVAGMEQRLREMPPLNFYLGAFDNHRLVGIATFVRETRTKDSHKGHIYGVFVTPSHRGRRIGRALIAALIERAKQQHGLEQIMLAVANTQLPAIALYRSFGFETYGTEPHALKNGDAYVDEHLMVLRLR